MIILNGWPRLFVLFLAVILASAGSAHAAGADAEEAEGGHGTETEHIFGFTDGSDIGEKGEKEIENTFDARFGKVGSYFAAEGETEVLYTVTDYFRASVAASLDYHSIQNVPDLDDRNAINFGGLSSEFRFRLLDRETSPIGLTVSIEPEYQHVEEISGALGQGYSLPITILMDRAIVPGKVFAAANIIYTPEVERFDSATSGWHSESAFAAYGAMTALIQPSVFLGGEVRYLSSFDGAFLNRLDGYAITIGPSLCFQLSKDSFLKFVWAAQVIGKATDVPGKLDLVNFERNAVRARLIVGF